MNKDHIRKITDYIPFVILLISAAVLLYKVTTNDVPFMWKQIAGLCMLPVILMAFRWKHKAGVLVLGLTLLIGLAGLLSYSYSVTTLHLSVGKNEDTQVPVFHGQPIFLLWLLIHSIVSGKHYVGILTKQFWHDMRNKPGKSIDV